MLTRTRIISRKDIVIDPKKKLVISAEFEPVPGQIGIMKEGWSSVGEFLDHLAQTKVFVHILDQMDDEKYFYSYMAYYDQNDKEVPEDMASLKIEVYKKLKEDE